MTRGEKSSATPTAGRRVLYGRRKGRRLRPGRRRLMEALLPRLRVPAPGPGQGAGAAGGAALDPRALFTGPGPYPESPARRVREVWLEVGFGAGEHLAAQAEAHPDIGFIGCEPYINGVAALLARIKRSRLANIRILDDDARLVIDRLVPGSLGRVFVLFPDPWPKARHAARRFINPETLDALARVMAPGAELRFATDDPALLRWALAALVRHPAFRWRAARARDWRERPGDQPATRYEEKARARGAQPVFLVFERAGGEAPGDETTPQNT